MKIYAINSKGNLVPFRKKAAGIVSKTATRRGKFGICYSFGEDNSLQIVVVSPSSAVVGVDAKGVAKKGAAHFGDGGEEAAAIKALFTVTSFAGSEIPVTIQQGESVSEKGCAHEKLIDDEPKTPPGKGPEGGDDGPGPDETVKSKSWEEEQQQQGITGPLEMA